MAQVKPLPAKLQKIAIDDLGEVPSRLAEDLQALKLWIQQQPHLRARTDDQFLTQFLRGSKYSLEKAKQKIDMFYSLKTKYPEMFGATNVDAPKFRAANNLGCFMALPKPLHENGPRIIVFQFNYTTAEHSIDDIFYPGSAMHELLMWTDPYACIHGIVYIIDFGKASASHLQQLTTNFCIKLISFLEKSMPFHIKNICYINTSPAAQQFFNILSVIQFPLFSEELKQRFLLCGDDMKALAEHIPLPYLPSDYGGGNGSCVEAAQEYNKTWDLYRNYFKENSQYGVDEHLRPGKPLDLDGLFGVGGSTVD